MQVPGAIALQDFEDADEDIYEPPPSTAAVRAAAEKEEDIIMSKQLDNGAESDTEADSDAAPAGSGPRGRGQGMLVGSFERSRPLCDGCGLCSLGRWAPWDRPEVSAHRLVALRELGLEGVRAWVSATGSTVDAIFDELAAGKTAGEPWPEEFVTRLAERAMQIFDDYPPHSPRPRLHDRHQHVRVRLLQAVLHAAEDPDHAGMEHFARGVRLGVNVRMPRTPAVYARKTAWRLPSQREAQQFYGQTTEGVWRENYLSVKAHVQLIERQLEDHAARDLALSLSPEEARRRFPDLTVVSLGAVAKIDTPTQPEDLRLVMDGTHGVALNSHTKPRDQDRCPTSSDVKRVQREQGSTNPAYGLAIDVREAHRLPPVHEDDWRHLACRAYPGGKIYVYMFGVFGYAASAYWWSRLGGAIIRSIICIAPRAAELWLLMMADDVKAESTSLSPRLWVLWAIVMLRILGVPLSWHKVQGGREISWIGYAVDLRTLSLGISASRAGWVCEWMNRVARDGVVDVSELRSVVGRLAFVAGALEYEKPFLSPIYTFLSLHPRGGTRPLPTYLRLVLRFLSARIARRRYYPSAVTRSKQSNPFRVDAHAEGEEVGVGGWLPYTDANGAIHTERSRWFALRLTRESAPWAFHRGEPFKAIAALEALAALIGYVALADQREENADAVALIPGFTDNRGNQYALSRLQTTKYPLILLVMELSCQLERRSQRLSLQWAPREVNAEADRLANGNYLGFSPGNRVAVDLADMDWVILPELIQAGAVFEKERAERGRQTKPRSKAGPKQRPFRERHPW